MGISVFEEEGKEGGRGDERYPSGAEKVECETWRDVTLPNLSSSARGGNTVKVESGIPSSSGDVGNGIGADKIAMQWTECGTALGVPAAAASGKSVEKWLSDEMIQSAVKISGGSPSSR